MLLSKLGGTLLESISVGTGVQVTSKEATTIRWWRGKRVIREVDGGISAGEVWRTIRTDPLTNFVMQRYCQSQTNFYSVHSRNMIKDGT